MSKTATAAPRPARVERVLDLRRGSRTARHTPTARKGTRAAAKARATKDWS